MLGLLVWELGVSILNTAIMCSWVQKCVDGATNAKTWFHYSLFGQKHSNHCLHSVQNYLLHDVRATVPFSHLFCCTTLCIIWITKPFCTHARLLSTWREKSIQKVCWTHKCIEYSLWAVWLRVSHSSHCSSLCRWLSEQQSTVIALHSSFHARCYFMSQGGKDILQKLIQQRFQQLEVVRFSCVNPEGKKISPVTFLLQIRSAFHGDRSIFHCINIRETK